MRQWLSYVAHGPFVKPLQHVPTRCLRSLCTKARVQKSDKSFSKTLQLPKTSFKLWNDPSKEEAIRERTCDNLYRWQWEHSRGPLFVFHDGPPYANGDLHMGHALNKICKDIINRYHVCIGNRVNYIPGWDCHGLPIENKVLKQLGKDMGDLAPNTIRAEAEKYAHQEVKSQRDAFRQLGIMADWSGSIYRTLDHDYELRQLQIFQQMVEKGLIYRHYRPVYYSPSSRSALAEAELVYNEKHVSHSVYVAFRLDVESVGVDTALRAFIGSRENIELLVWTTTPWTLSANMGIAVNPDMTYKAMTRTDDPTAPVSIVAVERESALKDLPQLAVCTSSVEFQGTDLVGASYRPLFAPLDGASTVSLPVVPSSHVTPDSGTGLVHCAPAHGAEDYAVFRALGLLTSSSTKLLCHVDNCGQFAENVADIVGGQAARKLVNKDVLAEGGKAMTELLEQVDALKRRERIRHKYPYDWKTDKPVIVTATSQWFANLDGIKDDAIAALQEVEFYPSGSRNRLESFVRSRSEWCISRQRVWGVPIPALHHIASGRAVLDKHSLTHILHVLRERGTAHWWTDSVVDFIPPSLRAGMDDAQLEATWRKGTDTMDVWFDSGSSWSMLESLYPDAHGTVAGRTFGADVCLEGSDQHRGWFQSQLLTALGSATTPERARTSPYGTLITHGMVLDETGKKMSKSLGNIVSPMTIIHGGANKKKDPAYGAEVLRLWAATVEFTKDMSIGPTVLAQCAETLRKIRNSARFILGVLGDRQHTGVLQHEGLGLANRFVMHELYQLEDIARKGYATYDFPKVITALSNFANITLSSLYFDITKDCIYADAVDSPERQAVVAVLQQVLATMTSVMAPVLPHLAEEIHQTVDGNDGRSFFAKPWETLNSEWNDPLAASDMNVLLAVRSKVLAALEMARQSKSLKSSLEADVYLVVPKDVSARSKDVIGLLRREEPFLKTLFIVSEARVTEIPPEEHILSTKLASLGDVELDVLVCPAHRAKCPRCWTYTCPAEDVLCGRCFEVLAH